VGISLPRLTRFKLWADYNKARNHDEKSQRSRLLESKKLLEDKESSIRDKEVEYRKMKTITSFQTNQKAVQESIKLMENEIAPLREWIESEKKRSKKDLKVYPVCSSQEIKDLMEGLALLKDNETNLRRIAEILLKLQYLNDSLIHISVIALLKYIIITFRFPINHVRTRMKSISSCLY